MRTATSERGKCANCCEPGLAAALAKRTTIAVNNRHRRFRTLRKLHSGHARVPQATTTTTVAAAATTTAGAIKACMCACVCEFVCARSPSCATARLVNTKLQQRNTMKKCLYACECVCVYAGKRVYMCVCNIQPGQASQQQQQQRSNVDVASTHNFHIAARPRRAMLLTRRQCEMRECHIKIHRHTHTKARTQQQRQRQLQRERTSEYSRTVKNKVRVVAERERGGGGGSLSTACM